MEQMSLFEDRKPAAPLASRLRPASLKEFVGQTHLLGEGKVLDVYKRQLGMQSRDDILVGYDLQQFVVADGKICAALTTRALETSNIRVLIRNSDFSSIYHDSVTFTADVPFTLRYGEDKSETFAAETVIDLPKDSPYLQMCIRDSSTAMPRTSLPFCNFRKSAIFPSETCHRPSDR